MNWFSWYWRLSYKTVHLQKDIEGYDGDSDVGDNVMLVTTWCWWFYDSDRFKMLVTESLCWRLFSLCWWFSQCIKSVTNILNWSPTSHTCHQHIWSPTSVTNIDVTNSNCKYFCFASQTIMRTCHVKSVVTRMSSRTPLISGWKGSSQT